MIIWLWRYETIGLSQRKHGTALTVFWHVDDSSAYATETKSPQVFPNLSTGTSSDTGKPNGSQYNSSNWNSLQYKRSDFA